MIFKAFYKPLTRDQRIQFAEQANTTTGYCSQLCHDKKKRIELGLADVFVTLSQGQLTYDELPLTDRARNQLATRKLAPLFTAESPASMTA